MLNNDIAKTKSAPKFLTKLNLALAGVLLLMVVVMPIAVLMMTGALIRTDGGVIHARIVRSDADLQKGLSGRGSLGANAGMLFELPKGSVGGGMWMKDMKFSIDMVWLNEQKQVIDIKARATPQSYPEVFYPKSTARYVLEIPDNATQRFKIDIGDTLRW